jgi:hypothetical protein
VRLLETATVICPIASKVARVEIEIGDFRFHRSGGGD